MEELVSIIVPAYNIEKYISRCINSITNQSYNNIEIIIINDGSTDNTGKVINNLVIKDNRIKVINQKNMGSIEARKKGIKIAKGKYILFVDGDDWIEQECIYTLYNKAEYSNSDIVLYNSFRACDNKKVKFKTFDNVEDKDNDYLKDLFINKILPGVVFKFIKKDFIDSNNIKFPNCISYAEDLALSSSIFMHNPSISYVEDYLYNYYQNDNSITRITSSRVLDVIIALDFIKELLIENNIYNSYKQEFEFMAYLHLYEYRFCDMSKIDGYDKKLYLSLKRLKINIFKNKYIKEYIKAYPISYKIRAYLYNNNYFLAKKYDFVRRIIKCS